jgi:hypothetical protein
MGFDVTFHSISEAELEKYVFDVLNDPSCAEHRAKEISQGNNDKFEDIFRIYDNALLYWYRERKDSESQEIGVENFSSTFSLGIAALSGYLHPFWYSRDGALSLLANERPELKSFFNGYTKMEKSPLGSFNEGEDFTFKSNYSASSVINDVPSLKEWLENNKYFVSHRFEADGLDSLYRSVDYCIENDLLFLEASDVVVPFKDQSFSDLDNFKAHFLKNI